MNTHLETEAHRLYDKGAMIIGVNRKVAVEDWGGYEFSVQTNRPKWAEVKQSLRHPKVTGIAIVLGPISGDLYCRDWDEVGAYKRWASEHSDLAAVLPTVRTKRGYHNYFRSDHVLPVNTYNDGELRGAGGYVVTPPTAGYAWTTPFDRSILLTLDPVAAGLKKENNRLSPLPLQFSQSSSVLSVLSDLSVLSVQHIIGLTTPTEPHQNHKLLFQLARGVMTLEKAENRLISLTERRLIFEQWYERAQPFLRTEKTFDDYLFEFLTSFEGVRHLLDETVIADAWARANTMPLPKVAECFETESVRLLVGLCRELQRIAGEQPFLLACRTVAQLFGQDTHTTAASWLRGLASARVIEVVERGSRQTNRASRYRYIQPLDDQT